MRRKWRERERKDNDKLGGGQRKKGEQERNGRKEKEREMR